MSRLLIIAGALQGFLSVVAAAFAAHVAVRDASAAGMRAVNAAVELQGWHALAIVACGLWVTRGGALAGWAAAAFLVGSLLFCGAAWFNGVTGGSLGPVAPTGGLLLMLGWLLLAASALRAR